MQKDISIENLPDFFGGSCKCEGLGCEKSDAGPWKKEVLGKYNFVARDSVVTLESAPEVGRGYC